MASANLNEEKCATTRSQNSPRVISSSHQSIGFARDEVGGSLLKQMNRVAVQAATGLISCWSPPAGIQWRHGFGAPAKPDRQSKARWSRALFSVPASSFQSPIDSLAVCERHFFFPQLCLAANRAGGSCWVTFRWRILSELLGKPAMLNHTRAHVDTK